MSRAWIAFYMGDYQKDTNRLTTLEHGAYFLLLQECWTHGKIPAEPADRAAITKMPLKDWLKIAPKIDAYFDEEGSNRRASKEIEKADIVRLKRAMAGHRGGLASGRSKAIRKGEEIKREANAKQRYEQNHQPSEATLRSSKITSTVDEDTGEGLAGKSSKFAVSSEAVAKIAGRA